MLLNNNPKFPLQKNQKIYKVTKELSAAEAQPPKKKKRRSLCPSNQRHSREHAQTYYERQASQAAFVAQFSKVGKIKLETEQLRMYQLETPEERSSIKLAED